MVKFPCSKKRYGEWVGVALSRRIFIKKRTNFAIYSEMEFPKSADLSKTLPLLYDSYMKFVFPKCNIDQSSIISLFVICIGDTSFASLKKFIARMKIEFETVIGTQCSVRSFPMILPPQPKSVENLMEVSTNQKQ